MEVNNYYFRKIGFEKSITASNIPSHTTNLL
jgi:hypothetical protein